MAFRSVFSGTLGLLFALVFFVALGIGGCTLMVGGCTIFMLESVPEPMDVAPNATPVVPVSTAADPVVSAVVEALRPDVTMNEYEAIKNGMSYREVVAIIGSEGKEMARNHIDGVPGVMESVETVMYAWENTGGSNMNAMFQNDKLMQKAQFGLRRFEEPVADVAEEKAPTEPAAPPVESPPVEEPKAPAPVVMRHWTDATGSYSVEAEFAGYTAGQVKLRKADGSTVSLPIAKLSEDDQKWIRQQGR